MHTENCAITSSLDNRLLKYETPFVPGTALGIEETERQVFSMT